MIRSVLAVLFLSMPLTPGLAVEVGDDGLHKPDWFSITFKDIAEDIQSASDQGKRLALIFEQRGCIYCKEVHETVLTDPEVREFIEANYIVVQFNLAGDEELTDTDGEVLTEKSAARKWGILFTPTILFMPEAPPTDQDAGRAAVAKMPGAFKKGTFLDMFSWVVDRGYDSDEGFPQYNARRSREREAQRRGQ